VFIYYTQMVWFTHTVVVLGQKAYLIDSFSSSLRLERLISRFIYCIVISSRFIQCDSVARGPKIVYKKLCYSDNDLKIYIHIPGTMQNRTCSYSMLKLVSFHIHAHLNAFLQILEYFSQICLGPLARESLCIIHLAI